MRALGRLYGASPWHLAAMVGCFALAGYAVSRIGDSPVLVRIALWFVGAAIAWDLVLGPAYALADRALLVPLRRAAPLGVRLVNHVRVPALLSSLLLLVWWPLVRQRSEGVYAVKTGLDQDPYLGRWLAVTAVLFGVSALLWLVRVGRVRGWLVRTGPATRTGGDEIIPTG